MVPGGVGGETFGGVGRKFYAKMNGIRERGKGENLSSPRNGTKKPED